MLDFFTWPIIVLILGLVALYMFKPAIERKISGITNASKDGVTFERSQEGGEKQPPILSYTEIMKHPITQSEIEKEISIEQHLQASGIKVDREIISILTRALATTRITLEFSNIAHVIYGSQINLLIQLVGAKNGIPHQRAEEIFIQAQQEFPALHGNRQLEDWLAYLRESNLVTLNNDRIVISQFGKDFLTHLVNTNAAYDRYG